MTNFLNNMVTGINKGISNVSENSKNIAEKVKLNMRLQDIEKQEKILFRQLGSLVYNLHISGDIRIEQCDEIFKEISSNKKQSEEIKLGIAALEQNGASGTSGEAQQIADGITCQCGCVNKKTDSFCRQCGTFLGINELQTEDCDDEI